MELNSCGADIADTYIFRDPADNSRLIIAATSRRGGSVWNRLPTWISRPACSHTAFTTPGWQWPSSDTEMPQRKSRYSFPASSHSRKVEGATTQSANPFHGYYFKILTRQGKSAPGGAYNYIINGNMIAGFALVAYPATWGNSGVMTFVINQEGRVYEKDLGPKTAQIAAAMTEYNPDPTWKFVREDWE